MFTEIRRKDRALADDQRVQELLGVSEYGFLSMGANAGGYGYGVPLSYAYDPYGQALYFHCAPEGQKLEIMQANPRVSFCVVGITKPVAAKFTTAYESVMVFGQVQLLLPDDEKRKALRLLVQKYSPGHEEVGEKYMEKSWARTAAFKIQIEHLTAKAKYTS